MKMALEEMKWPRQSPNLNHSETLKKVAHAQILSSVEENLPNIHHDDKD